MILTYSSYQFVVHKHCRSVVIFMAKILATTLFIDNWIVETLSGTTEGDNTFETVRRVKEQVDDSRNSVRDLMFAMMSRLEATMKVTPIEAKMKVPPIAKQLSSNKIVPKTTNAVPPLVEASRSQFRFYEESPSYATTKRDHLTGDELNSPIPKDEDPTKSSDGTMTVKEALGEEVCDMTMAEFMESVRHWFANVRADMKPAAAWDQRTRSSKRSRSLPDVNYTEMELNRVASRLGASGSINDESLVADKQQRDEDPAWHPDSSLNVSMETEDTVAPSGDENDLIAEVRNLGGEHLAVDTEYEQGQQPLLLQSPARGN